MSNLIYINHYKKSCQEEVIMGRIRIEDLPEDKKISKEEMKRLCGGSLNFLTQFVLEYVPGGPRPLELIDKTVEKSSGGECQTMNTEL